MRSSTWAEVEKGLQPPFLSEALHGGGGGLHLGAVAITPWLEDVPTAQAMTTIPPQVRTPRPNTVLPLE
jgi:hypothetical protein